MWKNIKNLFSDSNEFSHKRLISILSFIVLVLMIGISFITGRNIDTTYIISIASLIGGESLLTVIDKFKKS